MTNYILIQNDGEIESNSFELIGASTKRGETGKIGFFGSGLKYSIAYMMRTGIPFRVFSGESELIFTTKEEHLKGKQFERICIDGKQTSYTTTMGPTWTKDWFVLREIYCNAIDETNCQVIKSIETVSGVQGKTRIYIGLTEDLVQVSDSWDKYFSDERTPMFEVAKIYTSGVGSEDGSIKKSNYQSVKVYPKTEGILYRRGVRVHDNDNYNYDYELDFVNINEDRTAKNPGSVDYMFCDMLGQMTDENWVKSILRSVKEEKKATEYRSLQYNSPDQPISDKWVPFSHENMLVVVEISGRYAEEISMSKKEVFYIPAHFARCIKKAHPQTIVKGMGSVIGDNYFSEIDMTSKISFLLKEVLSSLKEMGYEVPFDVFVAEFQDENIMGQADTSEKKIYIASKTFDMGRREIAMTLMEETEHIKSGKGDETRAFQTHIFSQWLKMIEESNGLFL
jgi:hypothetical protein